MQRVSGFAEQGANVVWTMGHASANVVQETYPFSKIAVYLTGTTTLATLYLDNNTPPTPLSNPFTADENGWWWFYAPNGRYDIQIWPRTPLDLPWTIGDVAISDVSGSVLDPASILMDNGVCPPVTIQFDQNCDLVFTNSGGVNILAVGQTGDLSIPGYLSANGVNTSPGGGGVTTPSIQLNNGSCLATIAFDPNCNIVVTGQSGNKIATLSQQGNLALAGCLTLFTATCQRSICLDANCNLGFYDPSGNETAWITPEGDIYARNISGGNVVSGARQVIAGAGLTGGGPLSSDVTLALASDVSVHSISADTVYTCHIVCPGTLTLDAPSVSVPNILYVNGLVVDGIPVPPPPVASWNTYTPQLWDGAFTPITTGALVIGRYSVWGSWMVLSFGIQFNPEGYNQTYFHIGLPPGFAVQTFGVGLVFTCYFNNAPGLTPTIADWQVTPVGNVIRVATIGSTISAFMQMSLQGILEVD